MSAGFVVCGIVSLIMFAFGYLIWAKKQLYLIAGYNEQEFKGNKEKLAKAAGMFSIFIGVLTFVFPFGLEYIGEFVGIFFLIIVVFSTVGFVIYVNVMK